MAHNGHDFQPVREDIADDPRWRLAQRVAASAYLRSSLRLRDFLLYVTECALRDAPEEATEQQIGIHVFQRAAGYNSSEDSIVRTQARLLRQKLAAYFASEGADEELTLDIPKGQYLPVFHSASAGLDELSDSALGEPSTGVALPTEASPAGPRGNFPFWKLVGAMAAVVVAFLLLGAVLWKIWLRPAEPAPGMSLLWHPFLAGEPPLVIYSNAPFLREPDGALQWTSPDSPQAQDPRSHLIDSYTGVGEVVAVHDLTRLFDDAHASFVLKRSRLVTWDEARERNLIFIGAPSQNQALKVIPSTSDFTISPTAEAAGIVNLHPRPGELSLYPRQPFPETRDYAIVALVPATRQGRWMMVLAGLTTLGTQAATEFVCDPGHVGELLRAATAKDGTLRPFEAVIEVSVSSGVPLQSRLMTIHVR